MLHRPDSINSGYETDRLYAGVFGNNIGLNSVTAMQVLDSQVPKLELGSKLAFMNWIWYMCYIWCLKGVLLCLYNKLTYVPFLAG